MKQDQVYFDFHLLICTNERATGESCGQKGAQKLVEELKPWLKAELHKLGKDGRGRINKSGCLGRCGEGITCVAYPTGEWLTDVKVDDIDKLKTWIRSKIQSL